MTRRRILISLGGGVTIASTMDVMAQSSATTPPQQNTNPAIAMAFQIVVVSPVPIPAGLTVPIGSVVDKQRAEMELDGHKRNGFTLKSTVCASALVKEDNGGKLVELPVIVYTLEK